MQVISDTKLCIQDIVGRWPRRSHDQTIFDNSRIKARFEVNEFGNGLLLGDRGYGIKPYLITPLLNPVTDAEQLLNESQIRSRNVVERLFSVWKRRFPILSFGMRVSLERSKAIIVATAVLHNLAISEGEDVHPEQIKVILMAKGLYDITSGYEKEPADVALKPSWKLKAQLREWRTVQKYLREVMASI
ncbi:DDE superfamily endonuclease [Popillia japonica]|uniref:DDE superfamily endonuclease n=1 Tax=Popillia japonica TaxID=7064 RepID=A0AAW1L6K8_POPJA